ncbi:MAG: shikimate kinase AroK [Gammaproteobacteria bacterium]|nr:shikimate kinase AroK [Gammaproteobacteria bacterium]
MDGDKNIILVGLMGAGKTTIGKRLASTLGMEFVDSDHEIERRTGADIPWIFDIEGEEGFRRRERDVIADICQRPGVVLATGGGAVLDETNRRNLRDSGTVIYLCASVDQIYRRISRSTHRPLLRCEDPKQRLRDLLRVRDPLYREVAHHVIITDQHSVQHMVRQIMRQIRPDNRKSRAVS